MSAGSNYWTTPARKVTDYGEKIPTGTERYAHDGTVYRPEPFTQGPGEPATGTVRGWPKATWEKVHKLQREYTRETAQAWKKARAELAKLPETPTWPIDLRLAIEAAAARRDAAVAKVAAS